MFASTYTMRHFAYRPIYDCVVDSPTQLLHYSSNLFISYYCLIQLLQSILCIVLGLIFDINKVDQQKSANIVNNVGLSIVIIVVVINVMISAFDIKAIENRRELGPLIN